jgi:hypothetical protein
MTLTDHGAQATAITARDYFIMLVSKNKQTGLGGTSKDVASTVKQKTKALLRQEKNGVTKQKRS